MPASGLTQEHIPHTHITRMHIYRTYFIHAHITYTQRWESRGGGTISHLGSGRRNKEDQELYKILSQRKKEGEEGGGRGEGEGGGGGGRGGGGGGKKPNRNEGVARNGSLWPRHDDPKFEANLD